MITKEQTNILKAIGILAIILCHFWGWIYPQSEGVMLISISFCHVGVFLFLFLSGYGIMCSYKRTGLRKYWTKRLYKIYIPFLIVIIPQLLLEIWEYRNNIGEMFITSTVLSAMGLYPNNLLDGTLWFIPFILLQYLIFWLSFRFVSEGKYQKYLFIVLTLVGYIIFKRNFVWVQENDIYGFAFLFGGLYADSVAEKKEISKPYGLILCSICLICYCITLNWYDNFLGRILNCIFLACFEIITVRITMLYCSLQLHILSLIGQISYELFLTEGIFFWNKILYDLVGYNYYGLLLHWLAIIVMAILLQRVALYIKKIFSGGI